MASHRQPERIVIQRDPLVVADRTRREVARAVVDPSGRERKLVTGDPQGFPSRAPSIVFPPPERTRARQRAGRAALQSRARHHIRDRRERSSTLGRFMSRAERLDDCLPHPAHMPPSNTECRPVVLLGLFDRAFPVSIADAGSPHLDPAPKRVVHQGRDRIEPHRPGVE